MVDKPDIVIKLMEEEKLRKYEALRTNEGLEIPEELLDEPFEDVSEETVGSEDNSVLALNCGISDHGEIKNELKDSGRLLQNVFDAITDGISILDKELNIVKTNQFMKDMYSNSMPLIGKKCFQAYQKRESPCPWCPSLLSMKSGVSQSKTVPYPQEGEPEGWLNLTSFPLRNKDGKILGIIEYVKNITEFKKTEEKLKQKINELEIFHDVAVDREIKMINLEKEVNKLCQKLGEKPRYNTSD